MNVEALLTAGDLSANMQITMARQCREEYRNLIRRLDTDDTAMAKMMELVNAYEIFVENASKHGLHISPIDSDEFLPEVLNTPVLNTHRYDSSNDSRDNSNNDSRDNSSNDDGDNDSDDEERSEDEPYEMMTDEDINENLNFLWDSPTEKPNLLMAINFKNVVEQIRDQQMGEDDQRCLLDYIKNDLRRHSEMTGMPIVRREILRDILTTLLFKATQTDEVEIVTVTTDVSDAVE